MYYNKMKDLYLRAMLPIEYPLLANFLYEAIFVPPGAQAPARSVLQLPQLQVYTKNFGAQEGDFAFVAQEEEQIIGAAWCRIMDDYGHWEKDIPSLAMAVLPAYRGKGLGSQLLYKLLQKLQISGYRGLSLSVQKQNPAVRLYHRMGFQTVLEREEDFVMLSLFHHPAHRISSLNKTNMQ